MKFSIFPPTDFDWIHSITISGKLSVLQKITSNIFSDCYLVSKKKKKNNNNNNNPI